MSGQEETGRITLHIEGHEAPLGYYDPATNEMCFKVRWRGTNYWQRVGIPELIARLQDIQVAPLDGMMYNMRDER
jgi:hypothetical protein